MATLPYLTTDFPGIGGTLKQRPEDFFVQELPLYEPTGEGEHVYCEIQKVGMTTFDAVDHLAKALNISPRAIGYAGMKDARAVTRQLFSLQGTTEAAVTALKLPNMNVQWAARHGNKLRMGHLAANRFAIKIRDVQPTDVVKLDGLVRVLTARGMPNYFGEQRFGRRGNNDLLGAAMLRGDNIGILKLLLGSPDPAIDTKDVLAARKAFEARDNRLAMRKFPRHNGMERRVLARLMKSSRPASAVHAIDNRLGRLWISALQSRLFNDVLARRIAAIDSLQDGDFAYKHDNGACFHVTSAAIEQPRCDAFEISPTGPLLGYRMTLPDGEPLRIEQEVFAASGLTPGQFRHEGRIRVKGARRPLRVKPADVQIEGGVDQHGVFVSVAFTLPAGSFATAFLREIMKSDIAPTDAEMPDDDSVPPEDEP